MEFYTYETGYHVVQRMARQHGNILTAREYYEFVLSRTNETEGRLLANHHVAEAQWSQLGRPYYNIYPGIVKCLTRLRLSSIPSDTVKVPLEAICIRLPKQGNPFQFEFEGKQHWVRNILMSGAGEKAVEFPTLTTMRVKVARTYGVGVWIDIGEYEEVGSYRFPIITYRIFPHKPGASVEECLAGIPTHDTYHTGVRMPKEALDDCIRLACTLCLLDNDPSIIEPDVLAEDLEKYQTSRDSKFVAKAVRRGKIGWNVGRNVTMSPHYRGPSPAALYWTGKGRTIPKIRFRAGTIVHREIVEKIPQGYEEIKDGQE